MAAPAPAAVEGVPVRRSWLNRTTLGVSLASLFSDVSHELATAVLPAFLVSLGAGPAALGWIEGSADGLSALAKLSGGVASDWLRRRKPLASIGYLVTGVGTAAIGLCANAWQVMLCRVIACLRWLRVRGARIVRGNHDRALADGVPPRCRPDLEWLAAATAGVARSQLDAEELAFLRALPRTLDLTLDGKRLLLLHATPSEPLYRYLGPDPDKWRAAVAGVTADTLLVGHTHMPFHLRFGGLQVLNPGSLGQPRDGDPRAAYAVIDPGECLEQ
jgi:predicted phosphodiesterase